MLKSRPTALLLGLLATVVAGATVLPGASVAVVREQYQARIDQSATLRMHPQVAQPGSGAARADGARSAMSAEFKPARQGRKVLLQRRTTSGWVKVAAARQNGRGVAEFTAPAVVSGAPATYRAVAVKYDGLAQVATTGVATDAWGTADFSDEFTGTALGAAWEHRLQGYSPVSKRKCSKADPRAVGVGSGVLRLSVRKDPDRTGSKCSYEGKSYAWRINGHVGTDSDRYFRYGYAAARVKFQPRRGQHASFWLQPQTREAEEGPASLTGAEIDVIEWFGNDHPDGGLTSFIYHYPDDGKDGVTAKKVGGFIKNLGRYGDGWASKFHVFSVEWTPTRYIFRIDGKEAFRTSKGVSGQPQYLILSLLSSDYELKYLGGDSRLPQTMAVDWVRFWDREPSGAAATTAGD